MKTAVIILAAGYSSRMGAFKPLLPVGGERALSRAVSLGTAARADSILVVTGHRRGEIEALLPPGAIPVFNPEFDRGMFSSVRAGIRALPPGTEAFFLLPVDCAAVGAETLTVLAAAYDGCAVLYPEHGGRRGHPPLIPARFTAGIEGYDGTDGMRGFLAGLPARRVPVNDPGILLDMDTAADYAALLRALGLPPCPTEAECAALFKKYQTPDAVVAHGREVAQIAGDLAGQLLAKGAPLDPELTRCAALLHDLCRTEDRHAEAGAAALLEAGFPAVAEIVAVHMDLPENAETVSLEAQLVYLADKLCRRGRVVPLRETLAGFSGGDPGAYSGAHRRLHAADAVLRRLHDAYGLDLLEFGL